MDKRLLKRHQREVARKKLKKAKAVETVEPKPESLEDEIAQATAKIADRQRHLKGLGYFGKVADDQVAQLAELAKQQRRLGAAERHLKHVNRGPT